ncbi:MAG: hypothetical protein HYS32_04315 [Candidatus Woesearchaeota archaeon]|nr:MAG: hypothetical protein HYS32_04315 [Candidatus Woesearchaeota archaeon]
MTETTRRVAQWINEGRSDSFMLKQLGLRRKDKQILAGYKSWAARRGTAEGYHSKQLIEMGGNYIVINRDEALKRLDPTQQRDLLRILDTLEGRVEDQERGKRNKDTARNGDLTEMEVRRIVIKSRRDGLSNREVQALPELKEVDTQVIAGYLSAFTKGYYDRVRVQ